MDRLSLGHFLNELLLITSWFHQITHLRLLINDELKEWIDLNKNLKVKEKYESSHLVLIKNFFSPFPFFHKTVSLLEGIFWWKQPLWLSLTRSRSATWSVAVIRMPSGAAASKTTEIAATNVKIRNVVESPSRRQEETEEKREKRRKRPEIERWKQPHHQFFFFVFCFCFCF